MADLGGNEKVKVLLAQALFGDPDIILLDEPTNHLDLQAIEWLEDFLLDYEGTVKWGVSTSRSYFPKDNSKYFDGCELNLVDWLRQYSAAGFETQNESYIRGFLGRMLFSGDDVFKQVNVLSGGEKVRCMLSRMMLYGSNVLILDQPTNHLDLESITAVNNGLKAFKGNVIFASHDHEFVNTVANRIIDIREDGTIVDRMCTFDEYIEMKRGN